MITSSLSLLVSTKLHSFHPQFLSGSKQTQHTKKKWLVLVSLLKLLWLRTWSETSPKTSSHAATLSWHCTGGELCRPCSLHPSSNNTRPQRDEEERTEGWRGVEVRAQPSDRPAGAGVPLSLQLQWKPLPQWWGARRKKGGERWAGGKQGGGRCRWCA